MDLSNKKSAIQFQLKDAIHRVNDATTKDQIIIILEGIDTSIMGPKTKSKMQKFMNDVKKASSFTRAQFTVYNFFLKGEDLGVI